MDVSQLQSEIARQREALEALESRLAEQTTSARKPGKSWYRGRFYTSYYVMSGLILGALAAWVSLALNVLGALIAFGDPLRLLRVYATFFGGEAVMAGQQQGMVLLLAMILHSATGAVVGAPIHVIYSRYATKSDFSNRMMWGIGLGLVMWLVNFYALLSWLQPMVSGGNYIVEQIPFWVAALTHIAFTLTMMALQPYWSFNPNRLRGGGGMAPSIAVDAG